MNFKSNLLKVFGAVLALALFTSTVNAALPDGSGPWADEVVAHNQTVTFNGDPVSVVNPARSDKYSALGVAENDPTDDTTFFSLGFEGSITLRFDNGISSGVFVVEATNPGYLLETAQIEISADGSPGTWFVAGNVSNNPQDDGIVSQPQEVSCAQYVRIKDTTDKNLPFEPTADGFDVDGVEAQGEPCEREEVLPTPTPITPPSTPSTPSSPGAPVCSATTPNSPQITSATKTSPTTVELTWTAVSPVTHYSISYGTSPGNYQFGVPNTGNTTSYVIGGLDPNTTYYFVVYAVNDCSPSGASNEASPGGAVLGAATEAGQVLGASTDTLALAGESRLALRLLVTSLAVFATFLLGRRLLSKNEES